MGQKPKILGVITARGGSKGIPGKNIKSLGGKPLIAYTVVVAKQSRHLDDLIVSTDDEAIAAAAKEFGAEVPFLRPAELAQDDTKHLPVLQHALSFMEEKNKCRYDYVVTLQPTSPFRLSEDIDLTIDKLIESGADSAVSLVEIVDNHPLKAKKIIDGLVVPFAGEEPQGLRRQDLPTAYKRSAAVYVARRDVLMDQESFYGSKIVGYIVPAERSIDIDNELDWLKTEYMLEKLLAKGYKFFLD